MHTRLRKALAVSPKLEDKLAHPTRRPKSRDSTVDLSELRKHVLEPHLTASRNRTRKRRGNNGPYRHWASRYRIPPDMVRIDTAKKEHIHSTIRH